MKYTSLGRAVTAAIGISLTVATPATASVVIDQDALLPSPPSLGRVFAVIGDRAPLPNTTAPLLVNAKIGQSVTAGVAGRLRAIEVQGPFGDPSVGFDHAFRLSLYDGDLGGVYALVDSVVLPAIGFFPPRSALNTATTFYWDLSNLRFATRPGNIFSFSAELLGPPGAYGLLTIGNVAGTPASPLFELNDSAGGSAYYSNNGAAYAARSYDIGFRTYVDDALSSGVPEPTTWAMISFGFGAIGLAMRRRKAKQLPHNLAFDARLGKTK